MGFLNAPVTRQVRMRSRHLALAPLFLLAVPLAVPAQQTTDIFLADLATQDGRLQIGEPVNVTRRAGYDNQPWFLPDGRGFLYVSQRGEQTDVYRYDIGPGTSTQVTRTPVNEYSPTLPGDGRRMLVVRWPTDMSTGALWWYSRDGTPLEPARGSVPRVGYYAFADDTTLALFINDSIQSFLLADTRTGDTVRVGRRMGGSGPRRIPGHNAVSFLQQASDGAWWLSRLDIATRVATPLVAMLEGATNYAWTQHGSVLAARAGTIYEWAPGQSWVALATFTDPMMQRITRIAISDAGDRIAFVSAAPDARAP
jgi:hypothetical protein